MDRTNLEVSTSGTLRKTTLRGIISLLLLLLTATSAWATDYVFVYNGNYLGVNAAGTGIENYTTFNPERCVWTCVNGNNEATLGGTSYALRITYNGNTRYLNGSTTNGNAPTLSTTAQNVWRTDGTYLFYRNSNNYYLYYRGGSWRTSRSTGNNDNGYAGTGWGATNYRATLTASTTTDAQDNTKLPTVTCSGLSGSAGLQMSQNGLGGTYTPAATTITVGGTTYYKGTNGVYSTTAPSATLNPQYAWSINSGNANITNAGVLTLSNNNTQNVRVRLTITNTNPAITKTVDYNLTATATAALNETAYGDMTITPSAQTLDLGETVTYTASASINQLTRTRPQYVTITDQDGHTHYKVGDAYRAAAPTVTETPGAAINFTSFNWSAAEGTAYFTIDPYYSNSSNQVTLTRSAQKTGTRQTFTISVTGQYGSQNKTASATVTIPATQVDLTALHAGEAVNLGMGSSASINGHYTYEPDYDAAGAPYLNFRYTSNNTNVATVDASGNVAAVGPGSTTITITAVKLDGTDGVSCNVTVNVAIDPPTITIDGSGNVTISHPVPGVQIRYTTNGTDPTANTGTVYTASFTANSEQTIKAIAVSNGVASAVASEFYATSGISGNRVILNDYEDHTMSYYSAKPDADYPDVLLSPDPRNVKITYRGGSVPNGSAVAVSATESANEFVYYKTIEKTAWGNSEGRWLTGNYAYMVIPNPFSKRPKVGSTYYGFAGWKIISGGEYINGKNNNDVLGLEEKINFVNLDNNYTPNCTSAEIVFEATWTPATVVTSTANASGDMGLNASGTYETNFIVYTGSTNYTVTGLTRPATVSNQYPDGTSAGSATITTCNSNSATTKLEFIKIGNTTTGTGTYTIGSGTTGRELIVGRGCTGVVQDIRGNGGQIQCRIESGTFNYMFPMNSGSSSGTNFGRIVIGCDYDRAMVDNTKLWIVNYVSNNGNSAAHANNDVNEHMDITFKSGMYGFKAGGYTSSNNLYGLGVGGNTDNVTYTWTDETGEHTVNYDNISTSGIWQKTMSFYVGPTRGAGKGGINRMLIEGGELSSVNGGGSTVADNTISFYLRMKGGWVKGALYGGASATDANGSRKIVLTGGEINSWVAIGCNGTNATAGSGAFNGVGYMYVGGTAELRSHNKDGIYNNTWGLVNSLEGGRVFGGGRGLGASGSYSGSVTTSYVVVADEAFIEDKVYGGGCHGVAQTGSVYILGGTIGGNVYGGSFEPTSTNNTWQSRNTFVRMYNGVVKGGVYGGNDASGDIKENTSVQIFGGVVGQDGITELNGNRVGVFGGGLGATTRVGQDVTVTIGKAAATDGPTIYGDVYGGSALGSVNGTTASDTYHTNVTMNAGTVNGSIYGGGLGQRNGVNGATSDIEANVYGPVTVTINGGALKATSQGGLGAVFGCNNANGQPKRKVNVDVNGGEMEWIYGGGNAAPYTVSPSSSYDNFHVLMTAGHVKHSVFGGGLGTNAVISGSTEVKIIGPAVIDKNVYGGGNGGEVTGDTHVVIGE